MKKQTTERWIEEHPESVICEGKNKKGEIVMQVVERGTEIGYFFPQAVSKERAEKLIKKAKETYEKVERSEEDEEIMDEEVENGM